MVFFVEPLVEILRRCVQLRTESVDGSVKRIHSRSVSEATVFVAGKDEFLKLGEDIELVLHRLGFLLGLAELIFANTTQRARPSFGEILERHIVVFRRIVNVSADHAYVFFH
jgi:hypothetical protein